MDNNEIEVTLPSKEEIEKMTKNLEVALPSTGYIFDNKQITIFSVMGRKCYASDFARTQSWGWRCTEDVPQQWLSSILVHTTHGDLYIDFIGTDGDSYREKLPDTERMFVRPIIKYNDLSQFSSEVKTTSSGLSFIEFGEYPQKTVYKWGQRELNRALLAGQMQETGKTYTLDILVDGTSKTTCKEYFYEGKKYVKVENTSNRKLELSTGSKLKKDGFVWLKVSPIKWYVEGKYKLIISDLALISGLKMRVVSGSDNPEFVDTNVYSFLNNSFLKEIIPSKITYKTKKEEQKVDKPKVEKKPRERVIPESNIERIISDIYKYLEGNPNREEILKKLEKLTNEYNNKLDEVKSKKLNNIMTMDTYESVTNAFELRLEMMLVDVKKHHEVFKEYFDMIAILGKYISLVNGNKDEEYDDGFISDLDIIESMCLPFLKEEDSNNIRKQLIDIFNEEKKEITNYIDGKGELSYKTIDEMIIDLRRKIHPVLKDLSTSVNKRDVEVEIKTAVSKIIGGLFDEPKNEALSFYLVEINNAYTKIKDLMDKMPSDMKKEYKKEILDIMNMDIDYSKDFNDIANNLKTMWLSLNKVFYRIDSYLEEIAKYDLIVNLDEYNNKK